MKDKRPGLDKLEKVLQQVIFPDLLKGRAGFDLGHTQAVVYWMKRICEAEPSLNAKVLVTAAYAHDWGYVGLFTGGRASLKQVMRAKVEHMRVGAHKISELLRTRLADQFTEAEIERVAHLVRVHDKLRSIKADDEVAMVEADTLGALDSDRVKPTFNEQENHEYLEKGVMALRRPLFRHALAIEVFDELLERRVQFYRKEKA